MDLNCIAAALQELFPERKFTVAVSSIKDTKFPVFVVHTVKVLELIKGAAVPFALASSRVNSKDVEREQEISRLVTKVLVELFEKFHSHELDISLPEIRY
jgi:ribonuclease PH